MLQCANQANLIKTPLQAQGVTVTKQCAVQINSVHRKMFAKRVAKYGW